MWALKSLHVEDFISIGDIRNVNIDVIACWDSTGAIVTEDYKIGLPYNHPLKTSTTASYMLVHVETTAFSRKGETTG